MSRWGVLPMGPRQCTASQQAAACFQHRSGRCAAGRLPQAHSFGGAARARAGRVAYRVDDLVLRLQSVSLTLLRHACCMHRYTPMHASCHVTPRTFLHCPCCVSGGEVPCAHVGSHRHDVLASKGGWQRVHFTAPLVLLAKRVFTSFRAFMGGRWRVARAHLLRYQQQCWRAHHDQVLPTYLQCVLGTHLNVL